VVGVAAVSLPISIDGYGLPDLLSIAVACVVVVLYAVYLTCVHAGMRWLIDDTDPMTPRWIAREWACGLVLFLIIWVTMGATQLAAMVVGTLAALGSLQYGVRLRRVRRKAARADRPSTPAT
jgi:hypothetical protein